MDAIATAKAAQLKSVKWFVACDKLVASAVDDAPARLQFRDAALMHSHVAHTTVYVGCNVIEGGGLLAEQVISGAERIAFGDLLYRVTAMNSGRHVPEGTLLVCDATIDKRRRTHSGAS